ncbi:MAG: methyl-accepting chemotaxis protein [Rhodoferax sp.]|nr:methyl-accepting chemotaxis protein [Rhodoferax sp.]
MKWFLNLGIGMRLGLGFGIVLLLMVAVIYMGITRMSEINHRLDGIVNDNNVKSNLAQEMRGAVRTVAAVARNVVLLDDAADIKVEVQHIQDQRGQYDAALEKFAAMARSAEGDAILARIKEAENATRPLIDRAVDFGLASQNKEATAVLMKQVRPNQDKWLDALDDMNAFQDRNSKADADAAAQAYATARTLMFTLGVFALLLGISVAFWTTRSITLPLFATVGAANRLAAGDLTVDVPKDGRGDEVGDLLRAFSDMVAKLRQTTRDLTEGVGVLASSASEILATTTQVAAGAAETATAVSETTATVGEVKQTAQLASQKAKYVSDSAQKVAQVSQTGRKSVEDAIAGMHRIQEQMESIAESIVRLSEQSQAIGDIIATVNDLAEQSNVLAVNAAIEAAKAGDQGKGFAVVAQEVKSLAGQSKQATAQVRAILGDIQKATSAAVLATEQGHKAVEAGVKQSAQASDAIRQLAESINEAAQAATQIAASSQQQMVGMDQVALAMDNIKQASTQNVAGTRQAEVAAQSLHELGVKLKQLAEQYKV